MPRILLLPLYYCLIVLTCSSVFAQALADKQSKKVTTAINRSEKALFAGKLARAKHLVSFSHTTKRATISSIDSLRILLQQLRVESFSNIVFRSSTQASMRLAQLEKHGNALAKSNHLALRADYLLRLSALFRSTSQPDSALHYENIAFRLFNETHDEEKLAQVRANRLLRKHLRLLAQSKRLEIIELIPEYKEEIEYSKNRSQFALAYNTRHLAQIHRRQTRNFEESLQLFQHSKNIRKNIGFRLFLPPSFSSIGDVYVEMGHHDKAIKAYKESTKIADKLGFKRYRYYPRYQIGNIYIELGATDKAIKYYKQALKAAEEDGYKVAIEEVNSVLAGLGN